MVLVAVISIPCIGGYLVSKPLFCMSLATAKGLDEKHKNKIKNRKNKKFSLFNFMMIN